MIRLHFSRFITRTMDKFVTSLYRKPTFSGVYTHYDSYIPLQYKSGLVYTLLHRSYSICTIWGQFHQEIEKIKSIMLKSGYSSTLIEKTVTFFLNKLFLKRTDQNCSIHCSIEQDLPDNSPIPWRLHFSG